MSLTLIARSQRGELTRGRGGTEKESSPCPSWGAPSRRCWWRAPTASPPPPTPPSCRRPPWSNRSSKRRRKPERRRDRDIERERERGCGGACSCLLGKKRRERDRERSGRAKLVRLSQLESDSLASHPRLSESDSIHSRDEKSLPKIYYAKGVES